MNYDLVDYVRVQKLLCYYSGTNVNISIGITYNELKMLIYEGFEWDLF